MIKIIKKILKTADNLTEAEQSRLKLIYKIQEMAECSWLISEISRLLGKDNRTVKKYIIGNPKDLYKHIRYRYNPYENKVISLVKYRYIKKQIVDILIAERYKLSKSNARHMIHKIVKSNNLNINKYSPVINSIKTPSGAIDNEYIYKIENDKKNYVWKM